MESGAQPRRLLQWSHQLPLRKEVKRTPRRRRNAVTMHGVAKHAGVSPMTVSRALSGDAHVRELLEEIRLRRLGETLEPLQHLMNFTLVKRDSSATL
jgi:hypothetical protein